MKYEDMSNILGTSVGALKASYHLAVKKIEQILHFILKHIKQIVSDFDLFDIFKNNKRNLLFLLKNKYIKINGTILNFIQQKPSYFEFFYPEIKKFSADLISNFDPEQIENFEEKREIGENDSYICQLIRNDSIEDFVSFVNQKNVYLSNQVEH